MPSSNKTLYLALNKWLGSDKPKKDDFNDDNQIIDEAMNAMSVRIDGLSGADSALAEHTSDSAAHVTGGEKASWNGAATNLSSHQSNSGIHVTQQEKAAWSSGGGGPDLVMGEYTGNGVASRKITLGYHAQFGLIFAVNDGMMRVNWAANQLNTNSGCISRIGCSQGISLQTDGFTVTQAQTPPNPVDGLTLRLNANGVKYIYFIWK